MIKHNQDGAVSGLGISLVLAIFFLLAAVIFGGWAFSSRQDYKNNVTTKIRAAEATTQKQDAATAQTELAQAAKQPYDTFTGPQQYGSITFKYPKTWNAYVSGIGASSATGLLNGYFANGVLTTVTDGTADFALRLQILSQSYAQTAQGYTTQAAGAHALITATAYTLPQVPNVVGLEVSGQLNVATTGSTATMVILPERTNTIEIWTDGSTNLSDFNNVVLKTFSFSP